MYRFYEKSFARSEAKKRAKYGSKLFLEKYIPKYKVNRKVMFWLLPLVTFVNLFNGAIIFLFYPENQDRFRLISGFLWLFAGILWGINMFLHFKYHSKFMLKKIAQYEEELKSIHSELVNNE